jgi:hypothetical protein
VISIAILKLRPRSVHRRSEGIVQVLVPLEIFPLIAFVLKEAIPHFLWKVFLSRTFYRNSNIYQDLMFGGVPRQNSATSASFVKRERGHA